MNDSRTKRESNETRVELKYCEHCGGLWLRETGSMQAYCPACVPQVAQLPAPRKGPKRARLPLGPRGVHSEGYDLEGRAGRRSELGAMGGAA